MLNNMETVTYLVKLGDKIQALIKSVNQNKQALTTGVFNSPGFRIRTNFDVENANAVSYLNGGTYKTLAALQAFDTGTAQVIVADRWSAALLSVSSAGAPVVTWSATLNATTEAAAIAALPALPAGNTALGYVTVKTGVGVAWTAGTSALRGGVGGVPASATNYYNAMIVTTPGIDPPIQELT
jgi:hypothetical protein